jgi:hypothetical protein
VSGIPHCFRTSTPGFPSYSARISLRDMCYNFILKDVKPTGLALSVAIVYCV